MPAGVRRRLTLDELGLLHGTDKASCRHDYLTFYEGFLAPRRNDRVNLLEIGVGYGDSLKMWRDFFPNGHIIGLDKNSDCGDLALGERIEVIIGDSSQIYGGCGYDFLDIVVDDGSHHPEFQIRSYEYLVPLLRAGGIYILEDLHSYTSRLFMSDIARQVIGVRNELSWQDRPLVLGRIKWIAFKHQTSVTVLS